MSNILINNKNTQQDTLGLNHVSISPQDCNGNSGHTTVVNSKSSYAHRPDHIDPITK